MLYKNINPYFDSFNEDNQFYQVLFRPGYPIQTRELNELQSILQNQISKFGSHMFKEGAMVIPGQISVDLQYAYVKVESTFDGHNVIDYLQDIIDNDVILTGYTSGVKAKIIGYAEATDIDPLTVFVKYIGSGSDGGTKTFQANESVITDETQFRGFTVSAEENTPTGFGTAVNIQKGVYFVRGKFVLVTPQTLVLSKYSNTDDAIVGLIVNETFVTPEQDENLLDNAQGSSNYSAPGAHRHYIDLRLSLDDGSTNFVELLNLKAGVIQKIVDNTIYATIEETLARRTFDESGNYSVTPFNIQVKEHRNNNRGEWLPNTEYLVGDVLTSNGKTYVAELSGITGIVAPTHTTGVQANGGINLLYEPNPVYNGGVFDATNGGDVNKISISVDPGKAYVSGHEINNQSTTYVESDKALVFDSVSNAVVPMSLGSYVVIDTVYGSIDSTNYVTVGLYDRYITANGTAAGTQVGTAVVRYMEYDTGTIGSTASYVLSLIDIKLNAGKRFDADVRSIYFDNGFAAKFTANIQKTLTLINGAVSVSAGTDVTVSGIGTKFTQDLNPGDAIVLNGSTILVVNTISSDTSMTIKGTTAAFTNIAAYKSVTNIFNPNNSTLIMPIPRQFIRKVRSALNETISNASYYVRKSFSVTSNASGQATIQTSGSNETFANPNQPDSFIFSYSVSGAYANPTVSLDGTSQTANISGLGNSVAVNVIATVRRVLKERTKTITRYYSEDILTASVVTANKILLGKTDGIKLRKVSMFTLNGTPCAYGSAIPAAGTTGLVEIDITKEFIFNDGQTDAYYGQSFITRKQGSNAPTSPIRVVYDYYLHGTGDYFSTDSYISTPATYTTSSGFVVALRDCLDFRCDKFSSGFSPVGVPAMGFDFSTDYSYFLPRVDKLYLTPDGKFAVAQGTPSSNPVASATPSTAMLLATISMAAKTESVNNSTVNIDKIDNRRYTMRDIGLIDKRLQNVEYYTSLSLLEQQTQNLQLFDNQGNLNFKNGFIVEPFTGQNIADVTSDDFRCSIDPVDTLMRPAFSIDNVNMIESVASNANRLASHYVNNDNLLTLPFTSVEEITQPFASRSESITPFLQFRFLGNLKLTPSTDEWYETTYAPNVIINREGNYSALETAYKSQMGSVWNAWQNNWSTSSSTSRTLSTWTTTSDVRTVAGGWWGPQWASVWTTNDNANVQTTTTTVTGQVRTGTFTTLQAVYDTQQIDDRIISVDILPYIRPRNILVVGKGLKASTRLYPFFDSINVSGQTSPVSNMTISNKSGLFDTTTSAGSQGNHPSRRMPNINSAVSLSNGDVIHNGASNNINLATATAVVVLDADNTIGITNIQGNFSVGQTVYGTISGASATFVGINTPTNIVSNEYGEAACIFTIPSSQQLRFLSGQRTFRLTSSATNSNDYDTLADGTYTATGYLQTHQRTIVSTRNGIVQQTAINDSRTVTNTNVSTRVVTSNWVEWASWSWNSDPLAQSFMVPNAGGMFFTEIDVYFAGKDRSIPMWFNLVEMDNGLPTQNIVPGSQVILRPNQITTSANGSVPTRIKMPHPIFLTGGTQYAFVMGSDSPNYTVWVSHLGESDVLSNRLIVRQPYLGSMFKSQNASTWTPSQLDDIKFKIYRARFDYSKPANIKFIGSDLSSVALDGDSIYAKSGSNYIRVYCNNHGLTTGSKVTISGATAIGNIPANNINKQHIVYSVEFDSYVVQIATTSTFSGYGGGASMRSTKNIKFDIAQVIASQLVFDGTEIKHFIQPTNTSYSVIPEAISTVVNENVAFSSPMIVASPENETTLMSGNRSIATIAQMTASNEYVSPVLDLNRYSLNLVGNRISSPTTSINISGLDDVTIASANTQIAFSSSTTITTADSATKLLFLQAKIGKYITISGCTTNTGNNGTYLVTDIATDGSSITFDKTFGTVAAGNSITLVLKDRFATEIAPVSGSADAKYIMKTMTLNLPANQLSIFLDVNKPSSVTFELYYRIGTTGTNLNAVKWSILSPSVAIKSYDDYSTFDGVTYQLLSSSKFDMAQIKLVQKSSDTTKVAIVKNVRMIAMS